MAPGSTRSSLICILATTAALGLGAFVFAWSGLYNVAASRPHFAITYWLLEFTLRRSVETHSIMTARPSLDDPNLMRLGAGHFAGGCAPCHGAPGEAGNPGSSENLPDIVR